MKHILEQMREFCYARYFKRSRIQEKTILYQAYRNSIMAGNPYGIFRRLMEDPEYKDYTHIWVYRNEQNRKDDTFQKYSACPNVRYVKIRTRQYFQYLASCQFLISNAALPSYWVKKEGQIYINTWHGTPLKTLGKNAKDSNLSSIKNAQRNFFSCDYMVMPNRYTIERMMEAYDLKGLFSGKMLDAGSPRTDLVIHTDKEHIRNILEKKLEISLTNKKIVLYAPTFRSVEGKSINTTQELGTYMTALMEILPSDYELIFKVHNMMASFFNEGSQMKNRLIFDEIETNELLSVTDVLITDYSSIFFDFLCRKKPILFFVYDRQEYIHDRGLYRPLEELPGALCETIEDIRENFLKIQQNRYGYSEKFERYLQEFAYNDDGKASRRVVDIIFGKKNGMENYIYRPDSSKNKILVLGGSLQTSENKWVCIRILKNIDPNQNTIALLSDHVFSFTEEWAAISDEIRLIDAQPIFLMTLFEKICYKFFHKVPNNTAFLKRQYQKYLGGISFSKVMDLSQKNRLWKDVLETNCGEYLFVPEPQSASQRKELRKEAGHKMTVLFLAAFDSVNYVFVNLIRELEKRNYQTILIVLDAEDAINNKMFTAEQIPFIDIKNFSEQTLSEVDFVISTPFLNAETKELRKKIERYKIFCISFANLFSSIAMRVYTDLIFTIGASKFQEFEENGFHYSMVAAGNPQYDGLIRSTDEKKKLKTEDIQRILFIDQGGYPFGEEGKRLLGQVILAMAKHHPDKNFVIKPRYLPDEMVANVLHHPSEHIYDFIQNPPDNLILLRKPSILEDILKDFDAVVTMWSTAYLDAALRNIPVMLIRGLPSQEVADVRVQRIEEAFSRLEHTGCVVEYQKVLEGALEFHYVNEAYLKEEVEIVDRPCTPEIIDVLEAIYEQWIVPGKRPADVIQMDIQTFREKLPTLKTIDVRSNAYLLRRNFLKYLNDKLQALAFLNRCMAKPLHMETLLKYWYFQPENRFGKWQAKWRNLRLKLEVETVKRNYFCSAQIKKETDPIRLDYYYDWLFLRKKYRRILHFQNPNVFIETKAFYQAMVYLRHHNYADAAREFCVYYRQIEKLGVTPLKKDRQIDFSRFPKGLACAGFFEALYERKEYDILKKLGESNRFDLCMRTFYLLKVLREEKEAKGFAERYQDFLKNVKKPAIPKKKTKEKNRYDYYMECIQIGSLNE